MSILIPLPSAAFTCRFRQYRRRSLGIILILLVVSITIQTINFQLSSLEHFAYGRTALKSLWINDNPKEPRPQNEGLPPLVQQNFKPQQHPPEEAPPQGFQLEDGFVADQSQNEEALKKICQPKSHIVFLKTHKTASSTIQNILYRYGESRGLTFALPQNRDHLLFYPNYFATDFVEKTGLTEFDILCNHMRFRKSEVKKLMPEDSFYFSILRHPVALMESGFMYFNRDAVFHGFRSLDDFLDYHQKSTSLKNHLAHNNLAFDFGFDNTATADTSDLETMVNKIISGIEQDFHLILITEHFDESMILLRHALCWSLEDVVSFKINSRADQSRKPVSLVTAEKVKRWNVLDWRIYEHFNITFWSTVRSLVGKEQMKQEVSQLKELRAKLSSTCLEGGEAVDPRLIRDKKMKPFQPRQAIIQGYNLKPSLDMKTTEKCRRLITPEKTYTNLLYDKQFGNTALKIMERK